jgi:hypothetical protein
MKVQETTEIRELTVEETESASGGWMMAWRTQLIHMNYYNMNNFDDPTAVRYA